MMRRYFTIVGIILAAMIGLGLWLKPPLQNMRDIVDREVARYVEAKGGAGGSAPAITSVASNDWAIAVSHVVHVGEDAFYCAGAYRMTVCGSPD